MNRRSRSMLVTLLLLASACTGGAGDELDRSAPTSRYPRGGTLRVASEHYSFDPQSSYRRPTGKSCAAAYSGRCSRTTAGRPRKEERSSGPISRPAWAPIAGWPDMDVHLEDRDPLRASLRGAISPLPISPGRLSGRRSRAGHTPSTTTSSMASSVRGRSGRFDLRHHRSYERTLIVHLTRPYGDLPYLFAMPATAPIPEGVADGHHDYMSASSSHPARTCSRGRTTWTFRSLPPNRCPCLDTSPDEAGRPSCGILVGSGHGRDPRRLRRSDRAHSPCRVEGGRTSRHGLPGRAERDRPAARRFRPLDQP